MHVVCSLTLLQQLSDGGIDDVIAGKHALSSMGLHVTCASAQRVSPENAAATSSSSGRATALEATYGNLMFVLSSARCPVLQ
ncbi:hypothetical protein GQ457_03G029410 [Hibiscus cannabinus]